MANFIAVDQKFQVGALVKHLSNPSVTMVIIELVFKKLPPVMTAFGFYAERTHALFKGEYRCEWMDNEGKHEDVFHQEALESAA